MNSKPNNLPDIDIARQANLLPIEQVAAALGIDENEIERYGRHKAKLSFDAIRRRESDPAGKLILVSCITPTPAGEGKTTTTVGLGDALNRIGKRAMVCLREPSLGPCFGNKGGAAGGGYAQVVPMEDINLHFTGDFHAIGAANNLLAAMLDNHLARGNALEIDPQKILWKRAIDMNDRALRHLAIDPSIRRPGTPYNSGFEITAASEVMAVLCLSRSLAELKERLGRILVAYDRQDRPVTAAQLNAQGAMTVLLKDALQPNLVQTLENNPAFVHGGPFANIAHGCNSLLATRTALRLAEYTVTEAGFGADLGAEKFLNIKCRLGGLQPHAVVLVATIRALKMHGGVAVTDLAQPNPDAVARGMANLEKHLENIRRFSLPVVVAINHFTGDAEEELAVVKTHGRALDVPVIVSRHWAEGGAGAEDLAHAVVAAAEQPLSNKFEFLYPDELSLWDKVDRIARDIYGADEVVADEAVRAKFRKLEEDGFGRLPVCIAKTQNSLSADPSLLGRPQGFEVPIRDIKPLAGAGLVLVLLGKILTMPGLPAIPSAEHVDIDDRGQVTGLS